MWVCLPGRAARPARRAFAAPSETRVVCSRPFIRHEAFSSRTALLKIRSVRKFENESNEQNFHRIVHASCNCEQASRSNPINQLWAQSTGIPVIPSEARDLRLDLRRSSRRFLATLGMTSSTRLIWCLFLPNFYASLSLFLGIESDR